MGVRRFSLLFLLSFLVFLALSGCASGSSGPTQTNPDNQSYTVGGTVTGLSGGQVVLQINGGDNLTVSANGSFTFSTPIAGGDPYLVTVLTQPSGPAQSCIVQNAGGVAGGTVNSDSTSVEVTCAAASTSPIATSPGEWTWAGGSNLANVAGAYGQMGATSGGSSPGARFATVGWADASGNLWLYGGTVPVGAQCATTHALCWMVSDTFDDLWEFGGGEWTWMGGSIAPDQPASYGLGVTGPDTNPNPGSRSGAASWTDTAGNFWLFGGELTSPNNAGEFSTTCGSTAAGCGGGWVDRLPRAR